MEMPKTEVERKLTTIVNGKTEEVSVTVESYDGLWYVQWYLENEDGNWMAIWYGPRLECHERLVGPVPEWSEWACAGPTQMLSDAATRAGFYDD